jgi:hypothetical protein
MDSKTEKGVVRAKELLKTVRHATMATVNSDGSPHNTPFFFLHDPRLHYIYWGSHLEAQHSKNVLRTGQIFVVVYDAFERGGLYIRAEGGCILEGKDLEEALRDHNEFRAKEGKSPLKKEYYTGESPQRMWAAKTTNFWINTEERNADGQIIKDYRIEIPREKLSKLHSSDLDKSPY